MYVHLYIHLRHDNAGDLLTRSNLTSLALSTNLGKATSKKACTSSCTYQVINACPNVYPNNTPTDFRTVFDKPFELNGKWEVSLESIYCYPSQIHDKTEHAHVTLKVGRAIHAPVNDRYDFRYTLAGDDTWKGLKDIKPMYDHPNIKQLVNVLFSLNSLNDGIFSWGSAFSSHCESPGVPHQPHLWQICDGYPFQI